MGLRKRRRSGCWRAGSGAAEAEDVAGRRGLLRGSRGRRRGGAATTGGGGAVIVADAEVEVDA